MSDEPTRDGFTATATISGANPKNPFYPILAGDLLTKEPDGTFWKECPGLAVGGFELTDAQIRTLTPVKFTCRGLNYVITTPAVALVGDPQ